MIKHALEAQLKEVIVRAAAEIAAAVRKELADEVQRIMGSAPGPASQPAAKRGRPKKESTVSAAAPAAQSATAATPAKRGRPPKAKSSRKPHPARSYSDADIEGVMGVITAKPGIRSEQIKAAIGGDNRAVEKILERLRSTGRVKTTGVKRAMTYAVTGAQVPTTVTKAKAKAPRTAAKTASSAKSTRQWPKCSVAGCGNSMFGPSATRRLCYTHYQAAGGSHYSQK